MAKYDLNIREEELKHKVARDWFGNYDTTQIIDNIDFAVAIQPNGNELYKETEYLLWAEAKKGNKQNIYDSVVQLIFTIGKGRINEKHMPPKYIGAFDAEKIAFIPYNAIMEVFSQTDFNWNVPPSDHSTKEFQQLKTMVRNALEQSSLEDGNEAYRFDFAENRKELKTYISKNFKADPHTNRGMRITQNNFVAVYNQWRKEVMPTISIDFNEAKKNGLLDSAFYLADLMSGNDNFTLLDKLKVLLRKNKYILVNGTNNVGLFNFSEVSFKDNMQAHKTFWARYQRPPKKEYWDKIVERNDLLVPQDIREIRGEYFTPSIWVEKSQEYLAAVLGENWQDEYYIWDCCAGTGNLLANLTNKYNIWASTIDSADVHIMHERIASMGEGSNLLDSHVFQFDFLNDDLYGGKVPEDLKRILADTEERKKLVIYINPPYAEAGNYGKSKAGTSIDNQINATYKKWLGAAANELFALFLIRIYNEISSCFIAQFSTMKHVIGPNFHSFRQYFKPSFQKGFLVPADTFDNVKGKFPIGFFIWDCNNTTMFNAATLDVFNSNGDPIGEKSIKVISPNRYLNDWITTLRDTNDPIGYLRIQGNDFQRRNYIYIIPVDNKDHTFAITKKNLLVCSIYLSIRQCIKATWLNDRDSYSYPYNGWSADKDFQSDCLAYTLFHGQNKISSEKTINHWIPFTEQEIDAPAKFQSHFMSDFIAGKCSNKQQEIEYAKTESLIPTEPIKFSPEAQAVMDAGRELWYYYMHYKDGELYGAQSINVNASFYDIRRHFQGVDEKGRMNSESQDETYTALLVSLREKLDILASKIEKKVYEYGFLRDASKVEIPEELPEDEPDVVGEAVLPVKAPKQTRKTPRKPTPQTVIHYHIDHVDTFNDNSQNITVKKDDK